MARAIVTEQAIGDIDAEEHRRRIHGPSIVRVLGGTHRNSVADGPVRFSLCEGIARGRDDFASHLVVGLIAADRVFYIEVERIPAVDIAIDAAGLGIHAIEIAEKHRPLIDELW